MAVDLVVLLCLAAAAAAVEGERRPGLPGAGGMLSRGSLRRPRRLQLGSRRATAPPP